MCACIDDEIFMEELLTCTIIMTYIANICRAFDTNENIVISNTNNLQTKLWYMIIASFIGNPRPQRKV